jgi:hypothetical protein
MEESNFLVWFRRVVWAGIAANLLLALVAITATTSVIELLRLPPAEPLVWPRFASFLLILLSGFYVPAAIDPVHNIYNSVFTVVCRFGGVIFFSVVGGNYIAFGLFDLVFGLPEAVLLWLGLSTTRKRQQQQHWQ